MKKKSFWAFSIIGIALITCGYTVARAHAAQFSTLIGDPIPGGMCGCMSCNCYFPDGLNASEAMSRKTSVSIDPRSLTASLLEDIHDERETAVMKAQTPTTQTKTTAISSGSTVTKTGTTAASSGATKTSSAASTPTASLVSGNSSSNSSSNKASNVNSAASSGSKAASTGTNTQGSLVSSSGSTAKNSSGSPDDRDAVKSGTNAVSTAAKNSSGSPDDRDAVKSGSTAVSTAAKNSSGSPDDRSSLSATGKSSGTYTYTNTTSLSGGTKDSRNIFLETSDANLVPPKVDSSSYSPKTNLPANTGTENGLYKTFNPMGTVYYTDYYWRTFNNPDVPKSVATTKTSTPAPVIVDTSSKSRTEAAEKVIKSSSINTYYQFPTSNGEKSYLNARGEEVGDPRTKTGTSK